MKRTSYNSTKLIRHRNCTEKCAENCSVDGWLVQGEDGKYIEDDISIECGN